MTLTWHEERLVDPSFDRLCQAVEAVRADWPPTPRPPISPHVHPATRVLSVTVHGRPDIRDIADELLGRHGYALGGWTELPSDFSHRIWRKVVAR